ncbi:hypothetical protein Taro_055672 [Colocasia esculenta]|uniref:Retrotransposon gag domain-containing protein n=1 Tax=Colocasia esculenta TaxID=4460 RepID=A0A843XV08_COLES|nr:hypothetical protein [Colocasia esculenta]
MGDLAADESYLLKFFGSSLTGLAFKWYSNLSVRSIIDWPDMQRKFIERFYVAEREITLVELYATRQQDNESTMDYIKRWRDLSMRCRRPMHPKDVVQIYKQNLSRHVLEKMIGIEIKSFDRLNKVVAEIEQFLSNYPPAYASSQENILLGKRPAPADVHTVNLKAFTQQKSGVGSSSARQMKRNKRGSLQEKMQKPYSFPKDKTQTLFEWARWHNKIIPPEPRRIEDIKKKDDLRFCLYHQLPGHVTEDCYVLKDKIEVLIRKEELQVGEYKVDPPRPHGAPMQ